MEKITSLDTPEARGIRTRQAAGTTTRAADLQVLWIGRFYALIKWPGGYAGHGDRVSPYVKLTRHTGGRGRGYGLRVHDCNVRKDGRLTPERLAALIRDARGFDDGTEARDEKAAAAREREVARREAAETREAEKRALVKAIYDAALSGDDVALIRAAADYRTHHAAEKAEKIEE